MPRIEKIPVIGAAKIHECAGVCESRREKCIVFQDEKPRHARIPGLPKDFKVTEEASPRTDRRKAPVVAGRCRVEKSHVPLPDGQVETSKLPLDLRPTIQAIRQTDNTDRVKRREYQCHEGCPFQNGKGSVFQQTPLKSTF